MSRTLKTVLGLCILMGFSSCQTTGDPTQGGIFWSERKANERLDERRANLGAIEADTARTKKRNQVLEDSAARKRRYLAE
jgi:hypothetical protein